MKSWMIYFQTLIYSFCSHSHLLRWSWVWAGLPTPIIVFKAPHITYSACVCACVRACVWEESLKALKWKEIWTDVCSSSCPIKITHQSGRAIGRRTHWLLLTWSWLLVHRGHFPHPHKPRLCACVSAHLGFCSWCLPPCYNGFVTTANNAIANFRELNVYGN